MSDTTNRDAWLAVWRGASRPARWGLIFLSYAYVMRLGWRIGVACAT